MTIILFAVAALCGLTAVYLDRHPPPRDWMAPRKGSAADDRHSNRVAVFALAGAVALFLAFAAVIVQAWLPHSSCPDGYTRAPIYVAGHPGYQCLPQRAP